MKEGGTAPRLEGWRQFGAGRRGKKLEPPHVRRSFRRERTCGILLQISVASSRAIDNDHQRVRAVHTLQDTSAPALLAASFL